MSIIFPNAKFSERFAGSRFMEKNIKKSKGIDAAIIEKLRQTESLLKNLLLILPEQIYCMDTNGRIIMCNEQQAKVFGFPSSKDLLGKNIYDVAKVLGWNKSVPDKIHKNDLFVMKNKQPLVTEETILLNDEKRSFMVHKNPLLDENGVVIGIAGVSVDITDHKKAEGLLIEKEAAENSAKTMEMISGFIAHEMKTPLAVINLNNDLLGIDLNKKDLILDSKEERDKISNYHDNIKFSVRSANNVIDMLLTKLSNLNLSAQKLGPSDYEFQSAKGIINAVIKEYPFLKRERNLIHWDPNTNSDFKYFGDKDLTKNVLFNLVKNALRAIKEYDKGEIFITLKPGDKFNYLIFKDTGIGIAKEHMSTLFQQFNSHIENGTGLGLSFCKMVMKSYGGDITCKSAQGQHTEFTLSFPKDGGKEPTLKQKIAMRKRKLL